MSKRESFTRVETTTKKQKLTVIDMIETEMFYLKCWHRFKTTS